MTEGGESIVAYEQWLETGEQRILDEIAEYNEEDCVSTLKLRDWLLELRDEAEAKFGREIAWEEPEERERTEEALKEAEETDRLREALLAGVPDDLAGATDEQRALWLMAQLVDYHRREDKPVWWAFFERRGMSAEELVEDAECDRGPAARSPASNPRPRRSPSSTRSSFPCRSTGSAPEAMRSIRRPEGEPARSSRSTTWPGG